MSRLWVLVSLGLVLAGAVPVGAQQTFSFETTPCCLAKTVRPLAYRIDLKPDLEKLATADGQESVEFGGEEEVDIEVFAQTDTIRLNAVDLSFKSATLDGVAATVNPDISGQTATIQLAHNLAIGRHTLAISYSGKIVPQPHGLYYADYDTPSGKRRMLITQFEAADARRAFPCWDEPVFKATFALSAEVPSGFQAISNMPVVREDPTGPGKKKVTFAPTPKMSSYLAVLVAGEIASIRQSVASVDVIVDAAKGREEQGRYALSVVESVLPYYNDYFGVNYPLPKLDLIAVPNFAASAMENWGGITYIDSSLLLDPKDSTQATTGWVFEVVAHEMAHQWSGNLVTMAWWNNLWLNEGFASWMQKKAADRFNPAWKIWPRAHADKEQAMAQDALRTAHPIQQDIADESKIDSAFDRINYQKGEAVIRMLEAYLGEEQFRSGMRLYMKAHAYSNSTAADLWAALEKASRKRVASIAAGFIDYPGIPLIQVTTKGANDKTLVTLRQDRFTLHNPYAERRTWQVPVTLARLGDSRPRTLIVGEDPKLVTFTGCNNPVKVNVGDVGYYRVQYDDAALKALGASYRQLAPEDRVNLLADVWAMVQAGRADPQSYLDLTKQLTGETDLAVWTQVIDTLRQIDDLERGSPGRDAFRSFASGLVKPVLDRLGWAPEDDDASKAPLDLLLRSLVITTLGRLGDQSVIDEAGRRFVLFRQTPETLHKELREAVATVVGYAADRNTFDALRELGRKSPGTEAKLRYYYALAGTGDPALIEEAVKIALTDEVPSGRINRYLAQAASASDDPDRVWKLVFEAQDAISKKLTSGQKQKLLSEIARASSNPAIAFDLKWKATAAGLSEGARYEADKAVEEIEFKAEFKARLLPRVEEWLKANRSG